MQGKHNKLVFTFFRLLHYSVNITTISSQYIEQKKESETSLYIIKMLNQVNGVHSVCTYHHCQNIEIHPTACK